MELGNAVFGCSRGEYSIPRIEEYERPFFKLMDAYGDESGYGDEFENDTFSIKPYYWGDCTCKYDEIEAAWCEENKHSKTCYQTEYDALPQDSVDTWRKSTFDAMRLCKKHGIEWNDGYGSAVHCTCDYESKWIEFTNMHGHRDHCLLVLPNFLHKTTGFSVKWYKYPLRDAYMSHNFTPEQWLSVIRDCIKSLTTPQKV